MDDTKIRNFGINSIIAFGKCSLNDSASKKMMMQFGVAFLMLAD
jgi:hypothetical protein